MLRRVCWEWAVYFELKRLIILQSDGGIVHGQSLFGVEQFMLVLTLPAAKELTHCLVLVAHPQAEGIETFGLVVHIESVYFLPIARGRAFPIDSRNGLSGS
jgi:hypothetical protein